MEYVDLKVEAVGRTQKALKLVHDGQTEWVPRSTLEDHGAEIDELFFDQPEDGISIRITEWKAEELGWW